MYGVNGGNEQHDIGNGISDPAAHLQVYEIVYPGKSFFVWAHLSVFGARHDQEDNEDCEEKIADNESHE